MKNTLFICLLLFISNFNFAQNMPNTRGVLIVGEKPIAAPPDTCCTFTLDGLCPPKVKARVYGDMRLYGRLLLRNENDNIFIGDDAGKNDDAGSENIAIGLNALFENTTKSNLIAIGDDALYNNGVSPTGGLPTSTEAINNLAIGSKALFSNTLGSGNLAIGSFALTGNTNGDCNVATGKDALKSHTSGSWNVAYGCGAMIEHEMGEGNTAVGHESLDKIENGDYNTSIGYRAHLNGIVGQTINYSTVVGANAETDGSNTVILGNSNAMTIGGYQNWSNVSDKRFKTKIKQNVPGLKFINELKPVTYQMDMDAIGKTRKYRPNNEFWKQSELKKGEIRYTGFLAQDVEEAAEKIDYDFSGVDQPQNERDHYKLRYAEFVVPLVKAVQELSEKNEAKDAKIEELESRLARIEALLNQKITTETHEESIQLNSAKLEQNAPNPFTETTQIDYFIPEGVHSANLQIIDANGKIIKIINIEDTGRGQVMLEASLLNAGIYSYTLTLDGKIITTKQMILTE